MTVGAVVLAIVGIIVAGEYKHWGPWLADTLVRIAALLVSKTERTRRRDEWLADLDALRQEKEVPGVLWAVGVVLASPRVAFVTRRASARSRQGLIARLSDWLVAAMFSLVTRSFERSAPALPTSWEVPRAVRQARDKEIQRMLEKFRNP